MIKATDIHKSYGALEVLRGVSLEVSRGEVVSIVGASGAGKTTLLQILGTLSKADRGSVEIDGQDVSSLGDRALSRFRNEKIGFVFQFHHLLPEFTAFENVCIPGLIGRRPKAEVERRAGELLALVGLTQRRDHKPGELSGGEQQRVNIARGFAVDYPILLLDEPVNGLDPAGMKKTRDLLKMLCMEYGITIMISSHILSEIESIADTIGVINHGVLMKETSMKEISESSLLYIELCVINIKKASYVLADKLGIDNFKIMEDGKIRIYDQKVSVQELSKVLAINDVEITAVNKKTESLEDYFLKMTAEVM